MFALVPRMVDLQLGLLGVGVVLRRLQHDDDDPQSRGIDAAVALYGG